MAHHKRIAEVSRRPGLASEDRRFRAVDDPSDRNVYKILEDDAFGKRPGPVFRGGFFQAMDESKWDGTVYILVDLLVSNDNDIIVPVVRVLHAIADDHGPFDDLDDENNMDVSGGGEEEDDSVAEDDEDKVDGEKDKAGDGEEPIFRMSDNDQGL